MASLVSRNLPMPLDTRVGESAGICPPESVDPFRLLVQDIRQYLGESSGIDSAHIDPEYIISLMAKYTSNPKEWEQYARADTSRNYTRNLVDNINGKANLVSQRDECCMHARSQAYPSDRSSLCGTHKRAHLFMTTPTLTVS